MTERLEVPRTKGRFGTDAHNNFELLIGEIDGDLRRSGNGYRLKTEPFLTPSGLPTERRAGDSLGLDVVLEFNGTPVKAFDLKTGGGMSQARRAELARRFVLPESAIEELFR
ncbi:MAG TPA: hypothetical protein VGJ05_02860 [Fimbriiglobus sp.]